MALRSPPQGIAAHRAGRSFEGELVISFGGIVTLSECSTLAGFRFIRLNSCMVRRDFPLV
jgi:hypothetical protein